MGLRFKVAQHSRPRTLLFKGSASTEQKFNAWGHKVGCEENVGLSEVDLFVSFGLTLGDSPVGEVGALTIKQFESQVKSVRIGKTMANPYFCLLLLSISLSARSLRKASEKMDLTPAEVGGLLLFLEKKIFKTCISEMNPCTSEAHVVLEA